MSQNTEYWNADHLEARRTRYAETLEAGDALIIIGAGEHISQPGGLDQTYRFLSHPNYYVLSEQECPGGIIAYDEQSGWESFVPVISADDKVWDGDPGWVGKPLTELAGWLAARRGRPIASLGVDVPGLVADSAETSRCMDNITKARRIKDTAELEAIKEAVAASVAAYANVPERCQPGVSEREIALALEYDFFRNGGDRPAYGSIIAAGWRASVFHGEPSERPLDAGELVLIDAGAERRRYASDVTRVFPVGGTMSPAQLDVYKAVLAAQIKAVDSCRPGMEYYDIHRHAGIDMCQGLIDMGILHGSAEDLYDQEVMAIFFPHGIGHLIGLGVRDASGSAIGRESRKQPGGVAIRCDMPLEAGNVLTIEPGLYFSPYLLDVDETRKKFADQVNWDLVDTVRKEVGGIRIEDDVHVTADAPDILTSEIPKEYS